jgi:hypothetical protein
MLPPESGWRSGHYRRWPGPAIWRLKIVAAGPSGNAQTGYHLIIGELIRKVEIDGGGEDVARRVVHRVDQYVGDA